jgi:hypothetical protein
MENNKEESPKWIVVETNGVKVYWDPEKYKEYKKICEGMDKLQDKLWYNNGK